MQHIFRIMLLASLMLTIPLTAARTQDAGQAQQKTLHVIGTAHFDTQWR